jgi:hypothetical protein
LAKVKLPPDSVGSQIRARVHGPDGGLAEASLTVSGSAARPWAPEHLNVRETNAGLSLTWLRRCKEGVTWRDSVDAPLGARRESYAVRLSDAQGHVIDRETGTPAVTIDPQSYSHFGPRPWQLEVRQLGDFAAGIPLIHKIK